MVLPDGVSVMAMVHRHGRAPGVPQLALMEDWGTFTGAFATTVSHDSHNLAVFGRDPADMAVAANALIACGGGMAVAKDGVVTACSRCRSAVSSRRMRQRTSPTASAP